MRKTMIRAAVPAVALAAVSLLTGCGMFDRSTPDEFRVVARAPLEVPPDFNLRPPAPGTPRPQELARDTRATSTVFGAAGEIGAAPRAGFQSQGEVALLTSAGADQADPQIRSIVDRENPGIVVADRGFLQRLLTWEGETEQNPNLTVGANAQSQESSGRGFLDSLIFWRRGDAPQESTDGTGPTIGRTGSSANQ